MKANVGSYDAAARFVLGCLMLGLFDHGLGAWALLGIVPILSSILHFCPLYCLFRISSAAWENDYEHRHGR